MPVERVEKEGPELVDERLAYSEAARGEGRPTGEAGLDHLRRALDGIVVPTAAHAESLVEELCHVRGIYGVVGVELARNLKRKRGHYNRAIRVIVLYGTPRLATLLHEWAHHAVGCRYRAVRQAHGREFKAELRWAHGAIQRICALELDTRAAARELRAEVPRFRAGDRVKVQGLGLGRIERKFRTRYLVAVETRARGVVKYRVSPEFMEKV